MANDVSETTDYMVNMLANSAKLQSEDKRWYPSKNNIDDDVDDNINNYTTHHDIPINSENNAPVLHNNINVENNETHQQNNFDERTEKPSTTNTNKFIDEEYENLSPLEKRLRRLDIMRALGELRDLGCKVTNYNIDDDYYMMKYELDLHRSIRSKRNWLGLYSHMLVGVVKGVELLNNNYNPFDFSLKGLSDEITADKNTYYEILGEIYEYHNVPGKKMNPWFRLMISLIGVVVTVGGKNNAHKFIPNRSEKVEEDEDFIERLRAKAAKDSQSQISKKSGNQQNIQQPVQQNMQNGGNDLDQYMNKQHETAVQRAKDLEELKRQELEYQKYQQMLTQKKEKFNQMKKGLELTATARSDSSKRINNLREKSISDLSQSIKDSANSSKVSSKSSRKSKEKDTISEMSTSTNNTEDTVKSSVSQISINKNLANILKNKNQKQKKEREITLDQISFGSNKNKK